MDFERFKTINDDRVNYKEMLDATLISSYRNVGCGDGYRLYLKINKDKIEDASYTTTGCGFGLTALAMATEWLKGKLIKEAKDITVQNIEQLFEFPPMRKNYPESAVEAVQKAIHDYENNTGIQLDSYPNKKNILAKLKEQGHLRNENLKQIILEGEDLSNLDLSHADLSNAFLQNVNFEGSNLSFCTFQGAFLNNANLKNANLTKANLKWCKLTGANFENAIVDDATYDVGTRVDPKNIFILNKMHKAGKDIYLKSK